jgi:hypothetical protein
MLCFLFARRILVCHNLPIVLGHFTLLTVDYDLVCICFMSYTLFMYVLPSVSTFTNRNPSVTRFRYDRDSFELLDYTVRVLFQCICCAWFDYTFPHLGQVYFTNLSSANLHDAPDFVEFYSAKAYFGISNMSPSR